MKIPKNQKNKMKRLYLLLFILITVGVQSSFAALQLNQIQFDPAIISSGDEVDIVIEYEAVSLPFEDKIGQEEYTFKVELMPDDDISEKYIKILDSQGDDLRGRIFSGVVYNKVFRVKVDSEAPAANYQFKLVGRWYKDDVSQSLTEELKFYMHVKKEGIIIDVASFTTTPSQVRPGDNYVEIKTSLENVGEKDSKSVKVNLLSDNELIESSYSDNNLKWIGGLNSGESKDVSFFLDIDENLSSGLYNITYFIEYYDSEDNYYNKSITTGLLVKPRSYIEVVKYEGSSLAGESGELKVYIKNTGTQSAESVDVRIIKQSMQPFDFETRSSYVGELEPGEEGIVIFNFDVSRDAEIKTHDFKLIIRTKGDTDEGDDTIYTYNRRAEFEVTGTASNPFITYGLIALAAIVLLFVLSKVFNKKNGKKK